MATVYYNGALVQPAAGGYAYPYACAANPVLMRPRFQFVAAQWTSMWTPYLVHYEPKRTVIQEWVTSNALADDVSRVFYETDKDGNRMLEWHNGEIRNYITKLYLSKGLPTPDEYTMFKMYQAFDADKNGVLDLNEAQHLARCHVMSLYAALRLPPLRF